MMRRKHFLPNTFTALNLLCGFLAILNAADAQFVSASWLILLGGAFDALDGRIARTVHAYSLFGVEADSMADVVSFGVAPAVLSYRIGLYKLGHIGLLLGFLPLLFASVRLARFNMQLRTLDRKPRFRGLPAPAAAVAIATFVIAYSGDDVLPKPNVLGALNAFVSVLMVTNLSYEALPRFSFRAGGQNLFGLGYLVAWLVLSLSWPRLFMFPLWMVYVLSGPGYHLAKLLTGSRGAEAEAVGEREGAEGEWDAQAGR